MIPVVDNPEVISSGAPLLRIDMNDVSKEDMQVMLRHSRDEFYSNKELAPIREYSTNAMDSHIRKALTSTPIHVTLPNAFSPVLKIRDFGTGLSYEDIADVYFKYWKSTKRESNDENGCLGIGSKSAFAYTAMYTVTSWCEGMKTVIVGRKDGCADVIHREINSENEPEGVEVSIPVQQKDIQKFILEATNFFKYWEVRPIISGIEESEYKAIFKEMDEPTFLKGDGWEIRPGGGESVALMSNVPYHIDWSQVRNSLDKEIKSRISNIFDFLESNFTTFRFPNGTLSFTPNRESLQYNENTMKAISDRLVAIYDIILSTITTKISESKNLWDAKINYNKIFRKEIDEFDSMQKFGGNLSAIERLLNNQILWNEIPITNGQFSGMQGWDVELGHRGHWYPDTRPILKTFAKTAEGIVSCRCNNKRNNKISASNGALVIIQDTKSPRLITAAAKKYLNEPNTKIKQVYTLNLINESVRKEFFDLYKFDSVPVIYISSIEKELKALFKNKRGGGRASSPSATVRSVRCPSFTVQNRGGNHFEWEEEDSKAKAITGGIYVAYKRSYGNGGGMYINGDLVGRHYARAHVQAVYDICQRTNTTLDKVYGIHVGSATSKWFREAKKNGLWVDLMDFMTNQIAKLDQDTLKNLVSFEVLMNDQRIGTNLATQLLPRITDTNSIIYKYCWELVNNVAPNQDILAALKAFRLTDKYYIKDNPLAQYAQFIKEKFSMIFWGETSKYSNCEDYPRNHTFDQGEITDLVNYVNAINLSLTK